METKHDHSEEVARDMYNIYKSAYRAELLGRSGAPPEWDSLEPIEKRAWITVARKALITIGRHAAGDIEKYMKGKAAGVSGWKKALYWIGSILVGALAGVGLFSSWGCGHSVTMTPEKTEVCKDGSCLVIDKGNGVISFRQSPPSAEMEGGGKIVVEEGK